jgi:hypothetical protein
MQPGSIEKIRRLAPLSAIERVLNDVVDQVVP